MDFKLHAPYQPMGDQPRAIDTLVHGLNAGLSEQILLGVTGSGKTFTMANVIQVALPAAKVAEFSAKLADFSRGSLQLLSLIHI